MNVRLNSLLAKQEPKEPIPPPLNASTVSRVKQVTTGPSRAFYVEKVNTRPRKKVKPVKNVKRILIVMTRTRIKQHAKHVQQDMKHWVPVPELVRKKRVWYKLKIARRRNI